VESAPTSPLVAVESAEGVRIVDLSNGRCYIDTPANPPATVYGGAPGTSLSTTTVCVPGGGTRFATLHGAISGSLVNVRVRASAAEPLFVVTTTTATASYRFTVRGPYGTDWVDIELNVVPLGPSINDVYAGPRYVFFFFSFWCRRSLIFLSSVCVEDTQDCGAPFGLRNPQPLAHTTRTGRGPRARMRRPERLSRRTHPRRCLRSGPLRFQQQARRVRRLRPLATLRPVCPPTNLLGGRVRFRQRHRRHVLPTFQRGFLQQHRLCRLLRTRRMCLLFCQATTLRKRRRLCPLGQRRLRQRRHQR